jgi:hypothetical protein
LALILAHVAGILLDILECESDLPLLKNIETRRKGGSGGDERKHGFNELPEVPKLPKNPN